MNASPRLFRNERPTGRVARLAACAGAGALLAGCAATPLATAKVDPASPIAAEVAKAAKDHRRYPAFADIPPLPTDVRPARAYGKAAGEIEAARARLERETAESTWTLNDTLGFSSSAQSAAGSDIAPSVQDAAATEALARRLRERATPPPLSR